MEAFPPGPCVPCRNANRLSERKSGFVSSRDNDNAVRLKRRRRRRYFNLGGRRCGLHEREAQTVKGLTTGRFVILVAPWIPVVHANNSSVALNIELNAVVRFWHDASLCVMDLNSDVSNIAPVGCDLCTVRYKMDARWLLQSPESSSSFPLTIANLFAEYSNDPTLPISFVSTSEDHSPLFL